MPVLACHSDSLQRSRDPAAAALEGATVDDLLRALLISEPFSQQNDDEMDQDVPLWETI